MNEHFKKRVLIEIDKIEGEFSSHQILTRAAEAHSSKRSVGNTREIAYILRQHPSCIQISEGVWGKINEN
tara:strand:+ start:34 stop:243 length:210 start_codon:yes stop_codon:yes gene_type:complete